MGRKKSKQKKSNIILVAVLAIIIIAILLSTNYMYFFTTSFSKNYYVDFPQGFRPWRENYGDVGTIPLVVEWDDMYAHWKIDLTIKDPDGQSKSVTFYPTMNNQDTKHPSNWMSEGPHWIFVNVYPSWNKLGVYTITDLKLWATPAYGQYAWVDYHTLLDELGTGPISRRSIEVKHYPKTEQNYYTSDILFAPTTAFEHGETINVHYHIKNTGSQAFECYLRIFADLEHKGTQRHWNDPIYDEIYKEVFFPDEVISDFIVITANLDHSKDGVLWIGFELRKGLGDENVWTAHHYDTVVVTITEPGVPPPPPPPVDPPDPPPEPGMYDLTVEVYDYDTFDPVAGATTTVNGQSKITDSKGIATYRLEGTGKTYAIDVSKEGFADSERTVTLYQSDLTVTVYLYKDAVDPTPPPPTPPPDPDETPGFELLSLLVACGVAVILLKRRHRGC